MTEVLSTITEDHFEKKESSRKNKVFLVIFGLRSKANLTFDDSFSALLSKLHSESVKPIFDFFSTLSIVYPFRYLSKTLLDFGSEIFGNFVKTAFNFRASVWRETNLTIKKDFHIFWSLKRKIVWLGTTLVLHCWHYCVFYF